MAEQWVNVKQFPNYQVSPEGRVRVEKHKGNGRRYRELKAHNDADGNLYVWMFSNHTGHVMCYVAYLTLEAYEGPPPIGDSDKCWMAGHKDGNPGNCHYTNLRWIEGNPFVPDTAPPTPRSMYKVELVVCQRHTGRMHLYRTLSGAAAACNMSPEELVAELSKDMPNGAFLYKLQDKVVGRPPKPPQKDKVVAFDYVTGQRIVAADPLGISLLTGVDETIIWEHLNRHDHGMFAGYSWKWFKDPTPLPNATREEGFDSRVKYFTKPAAKLSGPSTR